MQSFLRQRQGFSLIWVAVVVAVMGIVLAASLPGGRSYAEKNAITLEHMQKIEEATKGFMAANLRRPCPADGTLAQTDMKFGVEAYSIPAAGSTLTGNIASGSNVISAISSMTGVTVGQTVTGAGIPSGSQVVSISGIAGTLQINNTATTTTNGLALTFFGTCSAGTATTPNFTNLLSYTAFTSAGSYHITSVSPSIGAAPFDVVIGSSVTANSIPPGARVVSIDSSTQVTIDAPANGNAGPGLSFTFGGIVAGTVPTKSLGLPDEYGLDGYGNRIAYIVDRMATNQQTCHDTQSTGSPSGISIVPSAPITMTGTTTSSSTSMTVNTTSNLAAGYAISGPGIAAGSSIASVVDATDITLNQNATASISGGTYTFMPPGMDRVMWALLSYGKDAHGVSPGGNTIATRTNNGNTNADTLNNAFVDNSFATTFTGMLVQREPTTSGLTSDGASCTAATCDFDDMVWYLDARKNTCCLGKACQNVTRVDMEGTVSNQDVKLATGDINGDGIPDLVYSQGIGGAGNSTNGAVYVIFGKKQGWPLSPTTISGANLDGTNGFKITTSEPIMAMGLVGLAMADVNGDGYDDIIMRGWDNTGSIAAQTAILFGGPGPKTDATHWASYWPATIDTTISGWDNATNPGIVGAILNYSGGVANLSNPRFVSLATGDINGDGIKDIVMADRSTTQVYVIYGHSGAWNSGSYVSPINVTTAGGANALDGTNGFTIYTSDFTAAPIDTSVAVGDVNGDGIDDIVLGGGYNTVNANDAYVLFGRNSVTWQASSSYAGGPPATFDLKHEAALADATKAVVFTTPTSIDYGRNVWVGDVNSDGIKDILVSEAHSGTISNLYVYYGKSAGWLASIDPLAAATINGTNGFKLDLLTGVPAWAGTSILYTNAAVAIGDVNGDGKNDILIGDYAAHPGSPSRTIGGGVLVAIQPSDGLWGLNSYGSGGLTKYWQDLHQNGTDSFVIYGPATNCGLTRVAITDLNADVKNDILTMCVGTSSTYHKIYTLWGRQIVPWDATFDLINY